MTRERAKALSSCAHTCRASTACFGNFVGVCRTKRFAQIRPHLAVPRTKMTCAFDMRGRAAHARGSVRSAPRARRGSPDPAAPPTEGLLLCSRRRYDEDSRSPILTTLCTNPLHTLSCHNSLYPKHLQSVCKSPSLTHPRPSPSASPRACGRFGNFAVVRRPRRFTHFPPVSAFAAERADCTEEASAC